MMLAYTFLAPVNEGAKVTVKFRVTVFPEVDTEADEAGTVQ